MTKTEARKRARRQLSFGHFVDGSTRGWVHCPECREKVATEWFPWETPAGVERALRGALVEHLLEDHQDAA